MQNDPLAPLLQIARQGIPFTSSDGRAFVRLPGPAYSGFVILPVRSPAFRHWFFHEFYARHDTLPTARAFHSVLHHLEAEAHHSPNQRLTVYRRVACLNFPPDRIRLDLANLECQYVEIAPTGWEVAAAEGVLLEKSRSTLPLPAPVHPGPQAPAPLDCLRALLNLPSRDAWLRCLAWLLAALRPHGPFPILILQGPPGSGKSLAARLLRSLVDPSTSPLTAIPASLRDLLPVARHNWVLAFDHISSLSPQLVDALCRLSSGLGATLRETAGHVPEPVQQSYKRPILLTVTGRWSCPPALAERALVVDFQPIPPESGRTEEQLLVEFFAALPAILGALCTAVGTALARVSQQTVPASPCANALAWALAASPALHCTEDEMRRAFASLAEPHPMLAAVRNLLEQRRHWTGTATELLDLLRPLVPCQTPKGVSQQLKKCVLTLADSGIELKFRYLHAKTRIIELHAESGGASCEEPTPDAPPEPDQAPQPTETEEVTVP